MSPYGTKLYISNPLFEEMRLPGAYELKITNFLIFVNISWKMCLFRSICGGAADRIRTVITLDRENSESVRILDRENSESVRIPDREN